MIKLAVLPNLLTLLNLYMGFVSILESLSGNYHKAAIFIIIAGLFDSLDGRIARLFNESSNFGREFDSVADIVSFGIAPAILIFTSNNLLRGRVGMVLAFIYVAAGAIRLARFNVLESSEHQKNFIGLPIPMAALMISSFILYAGKFGYTNLLMPFIPIFYVFLALLMISNIEYPSFKNFSGQRSVAFFFILVLILMVFILFPYHFLILFTIGYILYGVIRGLTTISFKNKKKA